MWPSVLARVVVNCSLSGHSSAPDWAAPSFIRGDKEWQQEVTKSGSMPGVTYCAATLSFPFLNSYNKRQKVTAKSGTELQMERLQLITSLTMILGTILKVASHPEWQPFWVHSALLQATSPPQGQMMHPKDSWHNFTLIWDAYFLSLEERKVCGPM